ncbi:MAG TPA: Fur family transcriptional regulator [Phycisphaerae bacterium]|nr:Fur family transcriptional regulator [Phycisphaerae bacterium]
MGVFTYEYVKKENFHSHSRANNALLSRVIAATQSNHPLTANSPQGGTSAVEEARNRIHNAGMRVTKPRVAIIESLLKHSGPISIERIHQEMGSDVCDLVTVYRCLSAFENLGMVRRSYLHNGTCLYELTLGKQLNYHVICKSCGQSSEVEFFPVEEVERKLAERGYTEISHVVEFFGLCADCSKAVVNRAARLVMPSRNIATASPSHSAVES